MDNKLCTKCNNEKSLNEFHKNTTSKDGYHSNCKVCRRLSDIQRVKKIKKYQKQYNELNKTLIAEKKKKNYNINKNKILNDKKKYYQNNKSMIQKKNKEHKLKNQEYYKSYNSKYHKEKLLTDKVYKLKQKIKSSIRQSLQTLGLVKSRRTESILSCTVQEFKIYIESKWEAWMNWENHGLYNGELNYGWDLDHIIPISTAKSEEDVIKLNHYTNFQPLCSYTNRYIKRNQSL